MNRIYNVYQVLSVSDMSKGPMTPIVMCKEHAKIYKELVKRDPTCYVFKSRKTSWFCLWCDEPEGLEMLKRELLDEENSH